MDAWRDMSETTDHLDDLQHPQDAKPHPRRRQTSALAATSAREFWLSPMPAGRREKPVVGDYLGGRGRVGDVGHSEPAVNERGPMAAYGLSAGEDP